MTTFDEMTGIGSLAARAAERARVAALVAPDDEDAGDGHTEPLEDACERRWHRAIPQRFHRVSLDFPGLSSVRVDLAAWGADPQGRNLCLFGPVGVGKTAAAVAACRWANDRRLEVKFAPVATLLDTLRPGGPEHAVDVLVDVDRLIVDDLGTEKRTDWTDERLYVVLNGRWLEERPTVITTNLSPRELEEHIGGRLYSRLVGNDAVCLRLTGPDHRRAK